MHSPVFGKQCPHGLQNILLSFGCRLFDIVSIIRPLQLTGSCSVFLCSSGSNLCVVKSYQKHKLEDTELLRVCMEICPQAHAMSAVGPVCVAWSGGANRMLCIPHGLTILAFNIV
jgi:hypothetical protein